MMKQNVAISNIEMFGVDCALLNVEDADIRVNIVFCEYHFTYLGLSGYTHDTLWMKLSVGVPNIDDEIIGVVRAAEKLGYEPHSSPIEIFAGDKK